MKLNNEKDTRELVGLVVGGIMICMNYVVELHILGNKDLFKFKIMSFDVLFDTIIERARPDCSPLITEYMGSSAVCT